jgi:hypothetical protein
MLEMIMKIASAIFLALFLGSIFVGAQKIEMVNGIRVIHNEKGGKWGANPELRLELVRTIGGLDAEENLSFNNPTDIVRDSAGNLYVMDSGNRRIQKLDTEGTFIKTIGRKGQGPGEFERAYSMDIDNEDNLFVLDVSKRIEVFSSEGNPLRSIKFRAFSGGQIRILKPGLIVRGGALDYGIVTGSVKELPKLLELVDRNGRTKLVFGEAKDYGDSNTNFFANRFIFDTDAEKNIYLSFLVQNRIEKYTPDGRILWQADRPLNYSTEVIEKGFYRRGRLNQGPKMNVVSRGIAADGKDRIWVITLRRQLTKEETGVRSLVMKDNEMVTQTTSEPMEVTDAYKLEIFSPDGIFLGEIPLKHHAYDIRIFGDNLFIRELFKSIFYQYKIVEK